MKILIVSPYASWPLDFGGAVRTVNLARSLAKIGYEIILLTPSPAGPSEEIGQNAQWRSYKSRGSISYFYNRDFIQNFRKAVAEGLDLVIEDFPYQAKMVLTVAKKENIPVIYNAHNIEVDRFHKMGRNLVARLVAKMESNLCLNAKTVLVTSENDRYLLKCRYGVDSIELPNGVNLDRFFPSGPDTEIQEALGIRNCKVALFFGTFDYRPNLEALEFLVNDVWPSIREAIPDARLLVVGKNPPRWLTGRQGIIATGVVDNIVDHIRLAHVVLAPLFSGGGTRLKIIEALACGQTVLSTPFGANGIPGSSDNGLILADRLNYAKSLKDILANAPPPCGNSNARLLAMEYDWQKLITSVDWEGFRI